VLMESGEPIVMNTDFSDHKIMAWLSPAYPLGSFSFSHGLEDAISMGIVVGKESLLEWLFQILHFGSGRNDAIFLCSAYRSSEEELLQLARIAESFSGTKERHLETVHQGTAFAKVTSNISNKLIPAVPLPLAIGYCAKVENINLERLLPLYLHAFIANLVSAAIRFLPLGQTDGQMVLFGLFGDFEKVAKETRDLNVEHLGNSCFLNDISSMRHETMTTRIFRS